MPRGNGKTSLAAVLGAYGLYADGVEGAEVVVVVTGQPYGAEGGLMGTAAFIAGFLATFAWRDLSTAQPCWSPLSTPAADSTRR
jgi:hypothetical protein